MLLLASPWALAPPPASPTQRGRYKNPRVRPAWAVHDERRDEKQHAGSCFSDERKNHWVEGRNAELADDTATAEY